MRTNKVRVKSHFRKWKSKESKKIVDLSIKNKKLIDELERRHYSSERHYFPKD